MKNDFNFCPNCGSKNIQCIENRKWICPDCGFDLYCNVASAVGAVITDSNNNVLFEVRAKEPRKGYVAFPGGFVDFNETAEQAIVRECKEEIGADINDIKFICTNPNTYVYKNIEYKTCDIFFTAKLPNNDLNMEQLIKNLKKQEKEVSDFVYYKVENIEDLEKIPFAFDSAKKNFGNLLKK